MGANFGHIIVNLDSLAKKQPEIVKGSLLSFLACFDEARIETYSANPDFFTMLFEKMDYKKVEVVFGNRDFLSNHVLSKRATARSAIGGDTNAQEVVNRWAMASPKTSNAIINKCFVSHVTKETSHKKIMILRSSATSERYLLLGSANASVAGMSGVQPEVTMVTASSALISWFEAEFANVQVNAEPLEREDLLAWGMACG